jgi:hypothetical protein
MRFGRPQISAWFFVSILFFFLNLFGIVYAQQGSPPTSNQEQSSRPVGSIKPPWNDEDWDSLSLETSSLRPEAPVIGAKDQTADFTRELIQVHWRFGDPIDLWVIKPRGIEKPPVVLYLYGYPSETDRFRDDRYCRRVTRGGFAAVGFVSALTGQRYHDIPMRQWFVSELQQALVETAHDVQMIIDYLSTRGDMDMKRIGMFGQGSGGTIAILAAAVDPRIKALNLIDPWGDWPDWMAKSARIPEVERPTYVKPEFLKQLAPFDPIQWLPKLNSRPVRILDVMDDPITPVICKKKIEAAVVGASTQIVKFDDVHGLRAASNDGNAFQWIKEQLGPKRDERAAN